jgi:putative ABC transport system permease protein
VALEVKTSSHSRFFAQTCLPLAPALKDNFPQVEQGVRFFRWLKWLVKYGEDKKFYEESYYFVDPEVFEMFGLPLVRGNSQTALSRPNTVVISENIARKYFGNQNPMGKMLDIYGPFIDGDYEITGVMRNIPHNSHLKFDFLTPVDRLKDFRGANTWPSTMYYTYIKTAKNAGIKQLENQIKNIADQYIGEELKYLRMTYNFFLQSLKDIHLYSHLSYEAEVPGNPLYIYIFTAVAIFILLIACINFMNLTTAYSSIRAREVGMRKAAGAQRSQLVKQFLAESVFLCGIAFVIAIILVQIALPTFTLITGKSLEFNFFTNIYLFIGIIGVFLFVGIVSGSYPAFFLSSLEPVLMTKSTLSRGAKTPTLRKALVIFQFTVSIILIVGSIIVQRQLNFMKKHELGFNKEQVVVLPVRGIEGFSQSYETIKNEFLGLQSVAAVTASDNIPGRQFANFTIERLDVEDIVQNIYHLSVDHDFIDVFNIKLAEGRSFQRGFVTDKDKAWMINEAAVKALGWNSSDEAVGKRIKNLNQRDQKENIIGVVRDFNYQSLHTAVEPLVMTIRTGRFAYLSLKVKVDDETEILASIRSKWEKLFPDKPFEYFFLDHDFERQYQNSDRLGKIFSIFTILAIIIACLGLLGLVSFMTRQRSKEVGIRKVVGASATGIVLLISKEFTKLVGIAYIIALPTAYFVMYKWLNNFAYRIKPGFWIFIGAGMLSFAIALLTMSYQAIKAARLNPVDVLKCE